MTEWRRHPRVKESIDVRWSAGFLGNQGNGTIRNVSISGLLLEVDDRFKLAENDQYILEMVDTRMTQMIPRDVKLIWFSRIKTDKIHKFCGMKFTNAEGSVLTRLVEHVEGKSSCNNEAMDANIIQNYLSQSN
jgi:Tfp pilus assembly protein PilZ